MLRILIPLLLGATIGMATVVRLAEHSAFFAAPQATGGADAVSRAVELPAPGTSEAVPAADVYLAAYAAAAELGDAGAIEARLDELLDTGFSVARDAGIAALFQRLAALDLRRAIRFAQRPGFDLKLIADILTELAEQDPEAALAALAEVQSPTVQLELAMALLAVFGSDAAGIETVAAVLPRHQRSALQIEALGALAAEDPDGALRTALALSDVGLRSAATERIGIEWARRDPQTAYSMWTRLPSDLQDNYRDRVSEEWARLDSTSFLAFANTEPTLDQVLMGLMHTLGVDPEATFEVAASHPPLQVADPIGQTFTVERAAFTSAAELDPERYRAMIDAMPAGPRKQELGPAFIEMYARTDPHAALAWAQSQEDRTYEPRVIRNVAPADYRLAYRFMNDYLERTGNLQGIQPIVQFLGVFAATDDARAEFATELLNDTDRPTAGMVLTQMLGNWVQSEPESALEWMLGNASAVEPNLATSIAGSLALRDAPRAAGFIERLPPELRPAWLQQVAPLYANQDPAAAVTWLEQFQGQAGYDAAYRQVLQRTAQNDPPSAALMLGAAPVELQRSLASNIANGIAREDLAGAARWATDLGDDEARGAAVSQVAFDWGRRDPVTAQRWALGLPRGETRDQALTAMLSGLSRDGFHTAIDARLFDGFASATARQQTAAQVVRQIAPQDPDRAEELMQDWITDPATRQQAARLIETARNPDAL